MLTKREFEVISSTFKHCCSLHCLPLDWDITNQKLIVTKSKLKLVLSKFILIWRLMITISIILRLLPATAFNDCDRSSVKPVFHLMLTMCFLGCSAESMTIHSQPNEVCLLFNQMVRFNQAQGVRFLRTEHLAPNLREKFFNIPAVILALIAALFAVIFLAWPNACFYHYSLMTSKCSETRGLVFYVFFVIETINMVELVAVHIFTCYFITTYFIMMHFWTKRICKVFPRTASISSKSILESYRALSILCNLFNSTFSQYVLPVVKCVSIIGTCLAIYGSIKLYGQLEILYYTLLPFFALACYCQIILVCVGAACVYDNSVNFQQNSTQMLLSENNAGNISRQLKSCKSLRTNHGQLYYFQKSTAITTSGIVINITVYLLVA